MKAQMEFAFLLLLPLVKVECSVDPKPLGPNQVPATSIAAPSAPRPKESTSSSIVLSFDRSTEDKLHDFNYYAKKFRRNQARHPDAKGVLCDTSAAVCRMEGLQSNTAYKFVVKACATKPSELCSLNSPESVVMYTKPETPDAPTVKESTSNSITVAYTKYPTQANLAVSVRASPVGGEAGETREAACNNEEATCHLSGLEANRAYSVSLKACTTDPTPHCSQWSESTTMYTRPNPPDAPTVKESTSNSITVTYTKKLSLANLVMSVRASPVGGKGGETREVACNNEETTCHLSGLEANRAYAVSLRACTSNRFEKRCSQWSDNTTMFTTPNRPAAPTMTESTSKSITVTYTGKPSLADLAMYVRASPVGGEAGETREAACDNEKLTCKLRGLKANQAYTVSLKACSTNRYEKRCSQWSEPTTVYTTPSTPSAPRPKESTSSSVVLSFDRSTEDKLHDFNYYAKEVRQNQARRPDAKGFLCDTSAAVCRMEGLQSNTAYQFVVKACATKPSELCSLNSPESAVMYTKPETPNAPTMKESTSNSITVTYTKKPSLADLAMSVRTSPVGGEAGETREFPCNNAKATCHLSGLEANRAYAVSLRACSTKRYEQRCSQWSDNTTMFTTPNQPDAPVLTESTSNSITVTYTKKSTETNLAVSVKASPVGGEAGETREAACNNEEATCHLSGLEANRAYSVSLKACTTDPTPHCSQWSKSTTIYTRPNQPRNLRLENVSSNQIEVSWEEPVPNAETISNYEVTAWDQNNRTTPCTFERSELKCSLKNLQPTTQYTVSVKACSRSNFCGAAVQASTWTRPEKPSNLVISRQEVNSIECKWQGLSSANKFVHYEVSLHYANSRHQIKAITVPAHRQVASFSYLHAHTSYSILLRACASDDSGRPRNCGEAVEASGYTRPSKPSALTIGERTSSTVLLHYRKLQEDNENSHFTYSLTYRTKEGGETRTIVCKTSAKTCYVTGLAANSEVTASLKACCSHGLCSPASPDILMYTKPGACENLRTINLAMTSIEVSWSKPRVNGEALTSYKAIATDPQGRQSFCVVPVENQERLVCTFQGLSPCLEYAISVNACARRNDCGLPVTMTASTLSVGVEGLSTVRSNSTSITFSWMPQSIPTCTLKNTTVVVRRKNSVEQVGSCSVSEPGSKRSCTVTGLNSNEDYVASAVACYDGLVRCSEETDSIEVSTLPGVPSQVNSSDVSAYSVVVKWQQPSGIVTDLSGFVARAYRMYENQSGDLQDEVVNCTASITEGNACTLSDLQPSTNYSIQVAAFKMSKSGIPTYGDESAPIVILTHPPFPKAAVTSSLLLICLLAVVIIWFMHRRRLPCLTKCFAQTNRKPNVSKADWWMLDQLPSETFTIEYHRPDVLQYQSQVPAPVAFNQLKSCFEALNSNNHFVQHFMLLKSIASRGMEQEYRLTKTAGIQFKDLNRYADMLPYDQSMVILGRKWPSIVEDPEPQITAAEVICGYINASYIRRPRFGPKGEACVADPSTVPEYIASQGPLTHTIADFLTMVYEQKSKLIVMLCRVQEDGKRKCEQYWPDEGTEIFVSATRSVRVTNVKEVTFGKNLISRMLLIQPLNETVPLQVTQYHYTEWPDYEVPDLDTFYELVTAQMRFMRNHSVSADHGPAIVHCSAGIGRSGTLIVARFLLDRLRRSAEFIDIFGITLAIRKWRPNLVQVWVQLRFLYEFVLYCIERENINPTPRGGDAMLPRTFAECANGVGHEYENLIDTTREKESDLQSA